MHFRKHTAGVRLYKEIPAEAPPSISPTKSTRGAKEGAGPKTKGTKGRGKKAKSQGGSLVPPPAEPDWQLLSSSTDELQAVGEELTGSKANAEADIGYQVSRDHTYRQTKPQLAPAVCNCLRLTKQLRF